MASRRSSGAGPTKKSSNGVLPAPVSISKNPNMESSTTKAATPKAPAPRLKLIVRRLPPGLTEAEFDAALGEEWVVGRGIVDWHDYKAGKVSKDPSKPSRPSRAYLRLTAQSHVNALSEKVKTTTFQDIKNTTRDPCLIGPPTVEFAAFGRVPGSRVRKDGRQGTIDQDSEFIDFLENLTNPVTKPPTVAEVSTEGQETKEEKVTITPLVQYLKDKKANKLKEKEASAQKAAKHGRQESKDTKSEKAEPKKALLKKESSASQEKNAKVEKATKDAVRIVNKQAAAISNKCASVKTPQSSAAESAPSPSPKVERRRERERGSAAAAAKILQRDLGLGGSPRSERKKDRAAKAGASETAKDASVSPATKPDEPPSTSTEASSTSESKSSPQATSVKPVQPPTGPASTRNKASTPSAPSNQPNAPSKAAHANPTPSPNATQAFLKHANPSQGVTEPLLESTFSEYGTLLKVEIDKKKGFGYLDFETPDGLVKAMAASPVKVGQSNVVVLERKNPPAAKTENAPPTAGIRGGNSAPPRGPHAGGAAVRGGPMAIRGGSPAVRGSSGPRGGQPSRGGRGGFRGGRGGTARGGSSAGAASSEAQTSATPIPAPGTNNEKQES